MKKLLLVFFLVFLCISSFAQEEINEGGISNSLDSEETTEEDPFADLFGTVEDVVVENQEPATPISIPTETESSKESPNIFFKPLTFSGHMEAQVGLAGDFVNSKFDGTGFLLFKNDLNLTARASKNLAIHGSITAQYPNFSLSVSSLYFDYLLLDRVYLSGGKKSTNWGYVQLFNDMSFFDFDFHEAFEDEHKYIPTNILSDSGNMLSLHVQMPVWTGTITGVLLYPLNRKTAPSYKDITFAGSIEMTVWDTAINLFGRKNPSKDSELSANNNFRPPVIGIEAKRTFWGYDVYVQTVVGIRDFNDLDSSSSYDSVISTAGFYRGWDNIVPKIGFNVEFQHIYAPNGEYVHTYQSAFLGGLSSLGRKKNMKLGLGWNHRYVINEGELTLAFTVSNILPHANWKAGLDMEYGEVYSPVPKFTLATSLELILDY